MVIFRNVLMKLLIFNHVYCCLEADFEVKTRTIAADFSTGPKAIEIVREELGDLPIGILGKNIIESC